MKHTIIITLLLWLTSNMLWAQQTVTPSQINQAISTSQSVASQTGKNSIISYTYRKKDSTSVTNVNDVNIDIQYFDGLGRPVETIAVKASPTGKDIVALQTYDAFGRADKSYLPYTTTSTGGVFIPEATFVTAQQAFLNTNYDMTVSTDNQYGYSRPLYEPSPLNRVLQQGAPGTEWQPNTHAVQYGYQTNASTVPYYKYTGDTYNTSPLYYAIGSLYVNTITDEDGKQSRSYTDKQGKVVMKEVVNGSELLQTRYCYDDFGLLRCVLQPMATNPAQTEYCFFYKYDSRKRMTDKKVPGSDWLQMVYDYRDRLVMTSDGNSRKPSSSTWYYTFYDDFNRPVEHGKMITLNMAVTHASLQTHFKTKLTKYSDSRTIYVHLDSMCYDTYPTQSLFSGLEFVSNELVAGKKTENTKGLMVGQYARTLEGSGFSTLQEAELYYFDKYGRVIQSVRKGRMEFIERTSNLYNFSGQVVHSRVEHFNPENNTIIDTYYTYDHRGRLLNTSVQVTKPSGSIPSTIVSANVYNEAGLLTTKYLHSQSNQAFMQKIDYRYNIRGWLTGINEPILNLNEGDKFGMKIGYNRLPASTGSVYYNGNISGIQWSSPIKANIGYRFSYDGTNRLTSSSFNEAGTGTMKYYTNYMYDKNGNLTSLVRMNGNISTIDALSYGYLSNSNQLQYAKDSYMGGFPGTNSTAQNFAYDANGNVTRDNYRNATISYNHLNLPHQFDFGNTQFLEYIYSGSGQKLMCKVTNGTNPIAYTEYVGSFIYEYSGSNAKTMKAILTPEGQIVNSGTNAAPIWKWEYNLTDHLGNVRTVISPDATRAGYSDVLQENSYYPFGMKMSELCTSTGTDNDRLYNGKELQDDFGLNWYDYGARFYDPSLGRFHSVDPLADFFPENSQYMYALNNPINYIDLYGLGPLDWLKKLVKKNDDNYMPFYKPYKGYKPKKTKQHHNEGGNDNSRSSSGSTTSSSSSNTSSNQNTGNMQPFTEFAPMPSLADLPRGNFAELQEVNIPRRSPNISPFAGTGTASFHGEVFVAGRSNDLLDNNSGFRKFVNDIAVYLNNNPGINVRIIISTGANSETNTVWNSKLKYGKVAQERGFTIIDVFERAGVSPNRLIYDPQKDVRFNKEKAITIQIAQ